MITKTVTSGQKSATATISEETKFVFSDPWQFYHVKNLGAGNIYVSMSAGASADGDGVIPVLPGEAVCTMHYYPTNAVYVTADNVADKALVLGSNIATSPFKSGSKGGGTVDLTPYAQKSKMFYPDNQYGGIISADLNAIAVSGYYTAYGTATGTPSASYSWFVYHHNSNVGTAAAYQRAIAYSNTLIVYERVKIGGVWGSWKTPSGGVSETELFLGSASTTGVTLSQAYTNFREIEIGISYTSAYGISTTRVHVADIGSGRPIIVPYVNSTTTDGSASSYGYARFYFSDATTFKSTVASVITVRVRGIN